MPRNKARVIAGSTGNNLNRLYLIKYGCGLITEERIIECIKSQCVSKSIRLLVNLFEHIVLKLTSVCLIITALQARLFTRDRSSRRVEDLKTAWLQNSKIAVFEIHKGVRDLPKRQRIRARKGLTDPHTQYQGTPFARNHNLVLMLRINNRNRVSTL